MSRPVIIRRSAGGNFVVMQAQVNASRWQDVQDWRIRRQYRGRTPGNLERAIYYAVSMGGFARESLIQTLGSWERSQFSPNPKMDSATLNAIRAARKGGKNARNGGPQTTTKKRGERNPEGQAKSRLATTGGI